MTAHPNPLVWTLIKSLPTHFQLMRKKYNTVSFCANCQQYKLFCLKFGCSLIWYLCSSGWMFRIIALLEVEPLIPVSVAQHVFIQDWPVCDEEGHTFCDPATTMFDCEDSLFKMIANIFAMSSTWFKPWTANC